MTQTEQETTEAILKSAAGLAKKLRMKRAEDMTTLKFAQPVMMVTATGITVGTIRGTHGREDGYRYDIYSLDETKLCSYTFNRLPDSTDTEPLWDETPIVETTLPEGAVLYTGRVPKSKLNPARRPGYHY